MKIKLLLLFCCFSNVLTAQGTIYSPNEVSSQASFPGGYTAYQEYLLNFIQPNSEELQVLNNKTLQFIVLANGSLSDIQLLGSRGSTVEKKVLEALHKGPKWNPAVLNGKKVACRVIQPLLEPDHFEKIRIVTDSDETPVISQMDSNFDQDNQVYNMAGIEVQPQFPGGIDKLYLFINKNFKKPEVPNLKGKIFVTFIIEKDGKLTDIKVIRDLGHGTKEEALRVMKMCPNWIPGEQNGKKVRVHYSIPINVNSEMPKPTTIKE